MAMIIIGGRSYSGNNVSIRNGVVTIDGKVQSDKVSGVVEIKVTEGVLRNLECDGDVMCGEVAGSVVAGGSVACGNVGGIVQAGGSVRAAGRTGGTIQAGGSVRIG